MARCFFTGGLMPLDGALLYHLRDLLLVDHRQGNGTNCGRTANARLANLDRHRPEALPILFKGVRTGQAQRGLVRRRLFFQDCAERWNFWQGREWQVSHYLFAPREAG